jgi:hypothetical protein
VNSDALRQLIASCRKSRERFVGRPEMGMPSDWCPRKILNPEMPPGYYFTDESAWEFIASKLESGHPYEDVSLNTPPDARGIVLKIQINNYQRHLYVKVQVGKANKAIGRSFHISHIDK